MEARAVAVHDEQIGGPDAAIVRQGAPARRREHDAPIRQEGWIGIVVALVVEATCGLGELARRRREVRLELVERELLVRSGDLPKPRAVASNRVDPPRVEVHTWLIVVASQRQACEGDRLAVVRHIRRIHVDEIQRHSGRLRPVDQGSEGAVALAHDQLAWCGRAETTVGADTGLRVRAAAPVVATLVRQLTRDEDERHY